MFLRRSGGAGCAGVWCRGGVTEAAFVFERAAAGARGVTSDVLDFLGRFGDLGYLVELEVAVDAVELDLGQSSFAECGTLRFDEFDDFHGGFESYGCRGLLVT